MNSAKSRAFILKLSAVLVLFTGVAKSARASTGLSCDPVLSQSETPATAGTATTTTSATTTPALTKTSGPSFDLSPELRQASLVYGAPLHIEFTETREKHPVLFLRDNTGGNPLAELRYAYDSPTQTLTILWIESQAKQKGFASALLSAALATHPETQILSGKLLWDQNLEEMKSSLAQGLSVTEALKQNPSYKLRAKFGYSEIIPGSINARYGYASRKPQTRNGEAAVLLTRPVGAVGMAELSQALGLNKQVLSTSENSQRAVLARYERRQYLWQSKRSIESLREALAESESQAPNNEDTEPMILGSGGKKIPARKVAPTVWLVDLGREGQWYFSAAEGEGAKNPRAASLIELLRQELDFQFIPEAHPGSLNDKPGVFTKAIAGKTLSTYQGELNLNSVHALMAFDYLVQHKDTHFNNFIVDPAGQVHGIDYPSVFEIEAEPSRFIESPFGAVLPPSYDGKFITKLKALAANVVRTRWAAKMSPAEIEAFLLTREVILQDAAQKGF